MLMPCLVHNSLFTRCQYLILIIKIYTQKLFAKGKVIIGEYSLRQSRGEISPWMIIDPEANKL